ncbi:CsgG/HfaB family protein [Salisaeta longa]|uniref:CsgG/HfaB family protein n=1 Tax=Salisaeta longa TaxID=503170 RepID=UPI0003B69AD7|nr:CsgG/HfaB family protein [Salisaeta longa]
MPAVRLSILSLALLIAGCANYAAPMRTKSAHPGLQSAAAPELRGLPAPQDKVIAAVYQFRDQTGQYKASEQGSSFSTAVTQGATSILMRALDVSGWFVPIEREGLSNLLNERQIIQQIRQQHQGADGKTLGPLPPLLYAGVLLEGGIIGYDTNVLTGGGGVRYFGIGGSGQYRQDQVTVYLRAISTQSGRVLATVHTTKTILSQKVDGGAFLYVDQDRLLEAEAGYSFNEPPVLAVTEAIDAAVYQLVLEGLRSDLWSAQDSLAAARALQSYDAQLMATRSRDYFDRVLKTESRPGVGIGASVHAQRYAGDYKYPRVRPAAEVAFHRQISTHWGAELLFDGGYITAKESFEYLSLGSSLNLSYRFLPYASATPYITLGAGLRTQGTNRFVLGETLLPQATVRVGMEAMVSSRFSVQVSANGQYVFYDMLDGVKVGTYDDSLWSGSIGFIYYTSFF